MYRSSLVNLDCGIFRYVANKYEGVSPRWGDFLLMFESIYPTSCGSGSQHSVVLIRYNPFISSPEPGSTMSNYS